MPATFNITVGRFPSISRSLPDRKLRVEIVRPEMKASTIIDDNIFYIHSIYIINTIIKTKTRSRFKTKIVFSYM